MSVDGTPVTTLPIDSTAVTKSDVGLGNVDNTADTTKPISAAVAAALTGKAAASHTHSGAVAGAQIALGPWVCIEY